MKQLRFNKRYWTHIGYSDLLCGFFFSLDYDIDFTFDNLEITQLCSLYHNRGKKHFI